VILEFTEQFQKRFRDFPKESKNAVFQYCLQNVDGGISSGMLHDLLQLELKYISVFSALGPEVRALLVTTEALFDSSIIPIDAYELLSQCCKRLREPNHAKTVFEKHLRGSSSYQSHELAAKAAECVLSFNRGTSNVSEIIPTARFFAMWYAVVAIERSVPGMNHESMHNLFWKGHEIALQLLNDPLMRPFAPVFAMLDPDRPIPSELNEFREETSKLLAARKRS
jgi:hypothetical protein